MSSSPFLNTRIEYHYLILRTYNSSIMAYSTCVPFICRWIKTVAKAPWTYSHTSLAQTMNSWWSSPSSLKTRSDGQSVYIIDRRGKYGHATFTHKLMASNVDEYVWPICARYYLHSNHFSRSATRLTRVATNPIQSVGYFRIALVTHRWLFSE